MMGLLPKRDAAERLSALLTVIYRMPLLFTTSLPLRPFDAGFYPP
jgi:hypothetical protein